VFSTETQENTISQKEVKPPYSFYLVFQNRQINVSNEKMPYTHGNRYLFELWSFECLCKVLMRIYYKMCNRIIHYGK